MLQAVKDRIDRILRNYDRGIVDGGEANSHLKLVVMNVPVEERGEVIKYCRAENMPILAEDLNDYDDLED